MSLRFAHRGRTSPFLLLRATQRFITRTLLSLSTRPGQSFGQLEGFARYFLVRLQFRASQGRPGVFFET